jgi:hypothetical protein
MEFLGLDFREKMAKIAKIAKMAKMTKMPETFDWIYVDEVAPFIEVEA